MLFVAAQVPGSHTSERQTRTRAARASEARGAAGHSERMVHFCAPGRPGPLPLCAPRQTSLAESNGFAWKG